MALRMLTTIDNPFDPRDDWDAWYAWDAQMYDTCGLLARVVPYTDDMSQADKTQAIEDGITEILEINASGMHTAVEIG